jgi:N-acetylglucosamine-6-phosphate deacetylase
VAAAVVDGVVVPGDVDVVDGVVAAVGRAPGGTGLAIPGLVDLQVNGYAGVDVLSAERDDLVALGRALARDGVLAYQPTLVTASPDDVRAALVRLDDVKTGNDPDGAQILGAHLEGPFLSPARAGAHAPRLLRAPDLALLEALLDAGCRVSTVTLAPELPGADALVAALRARGILVSAGHSDATAAEAAAGFTAGVRMVTHLFNAMRVFGHRDPGIVGAALAREDVGIGLIADGVHVADEALLTVWRAARGRTALVSDAIAAAGLGDGTFALGPVQVTVAGGVSTFPGGGLAGAVRPLLDGVRRLVDLGVPLGEAVDAAAGVPSRLLGRADVGRLVIGGRADLAVLDDALTLRDVLRSGRLLT